MFNATLAGAQEYIARLDAAPAALRAVVIQRMYALTIQLQAKVMLEKLSGQVLKVRTGKLKNSIVQEVQDTGSMIWGIVRSDGSVKYGRIHEYGGTTPPHDIYPKKADALCFMIGGKKVFAKVVHHPGSKMPERSFMRSSLSEFGPSAIQQLKDTVIDALMKMQGGG